ncbi:MAG: hypothetical protein IPQ07_11350 [Myxococcales bacterium]|nr:hypothetical protein [Myxococcales bacterium]
MSGDEPRRLLQKLIREAGRAEVAVHEHLVRERKRLGAAPPVVALEAVADHALAMQGRFASMLDGHELAPQLRSGVGTTLVTLGHLVVDRVIDPERAFRTVLVDLRHGVEVVKLLREVARNEIMFGMIRWCDDWLGARRTLVARVEAQLGWFADRARLALLPALPEERAQPVDDFEPVTSCPRPDPS